MQGTTDENTIPDAGRRENSCFDGVAGYPSHRPSGNTSTQAYFSDNYSVEGGRYFGFNKCRKVRCTIKCLENRMLLPLNNFRSTFRDRSFVIRTDRDLDCDSCDLVYLLTCNICGLQYVGETKRSFATRMRDHIGRITKGDRAQVVYAHFQKDEAHRNMAVKDKVRFQIIEKIRTGDLEPGSGDFSKKRRLERELFWISKLRTMHPFGLNDRIQACGISGNATDPGFKGYNCFKIENLEPKKKRKRRGRGSRKKKGGFTMEDYVNFSAQLGGLLVTNPGQVEPFIFSKQRKFLERFVGLGLFGSLDRRLRYLIERRVDFTRKPGPMKKERGMVDWKVGFSHKIVEDVGLLGLYNLGFLRGLLPKEVKRGDRVRLVYRFGRKIGAKILNYNGALRDAADLSYRDILRMDCDCEGSVFCDQSHGHIITGDLALIGEVRLRELCGRGANYREVPQFDLRKVKAGLLRDVGSLTGSLAAKYKVRRSCFKKWRATFQRLIGDRLDGLGFTVRYQVPVLSNRESREELERLHGHFVVTVVDKAARNFGFICRKFYFLRLAGELGLDRVDPGNDTYRFVGITEEAICEQLRAGLVSFGALPGELQIRVALLYFNPKFHKDPVGMRFIAGNIGTVTSHLDGMMARVLKMLKGHFRNYCGGAENFSGVRYCFDIEQSLDLKLALDKFEGQARSISVNDFSTLYTLFEHGHLLGNIKWLVNRLADHKGMGYIKVTYRGAYWVGEKKGSGTYSKGEILDMVEFLVGNSYVKAFGCIFRQIKGIIMGGKISGWLSDCSLMVDEFRYVDGKMKEVAKRPAALAEAKILGGLRRYRDDCTAVNIGDFRELAREIYPESLDLTQENTDFTRANVLDMSVSIVDNSFTTAIYCKADHFPFRVISFPFLDGNLSRGVCYGVFYSQVLRFGRLSSSLGDFCDRVKGLGGLLQGRGYGHNRLGRLFCRVLGKYVGIFEKWDMPIDKRVWFGHILDGRGLDNCVPGFDLLTVPEIIGPFSQPGPIQSGPRIPALYSQP